MQIHHQNTKTNLVVSIIVFATILICQVLFTTFIFSSFTTFKKESFENLIRINSLETAAKFEMVSQLGRNLRTYPSLPQDLTILLNKASSDEVIVLDNKNELIYSVNCAFSNFKDYSFNTDKVIIDNNEYVVTPFALHNKEKGYILLKLNYKIDQNSILNDFKPSSICFIITSIFLTSIFFVLFFNYGRHQCLNSGKKLSKLKYVVIPFLICQFLTLATCISPMIKITQNAATNIEQSVSVTISNELNRYVNLGLYLDEIANLDSHLTNIKHLINDIGSLGIYDHKHKYILGDKISGNASISAIGDRKQYYVYAAIDQSFYNKIIIRLALDLSTMIIIFTILAYELSSFIIFAIERSFILSQGQKPYYDVKLIRPFSFLCIFAIYMPFSILSLYMLNLAPEFLGLSDEFILSLPISVDMTAVLVASLLLLIFAKQLSRWQTILTLALCLIGIGMLIAGITNNGYIFILSRIFYGLGYGSFILGCQLYVLQNAMPNEKAKGLALFSSGIFSGLLCSCAFGGLIADRFGYNIVFLVSALIIALNLIILITITKAYLQPDNITTEPQKSINLSGLKAFFKDKNVISLLLFQAIPYSALTIGLFNFFLPVTMQQNGFSASTVGQINIIYTLIIVILAPKFGSLIDKSKHQFIFLTLGVLAAAIAPLAFSYEYIIIGAILGMILLGISTAINDSGQVAIISAYQGTQVLGQRQALLILDVFLRIGQIVGPIAIATALSLSGTNTFIYISLIAIVLSILFSVIQFKHQGS